jgi:hypothetical protein
MSLALAGLAVQGALGLGQMIGGLAKKKPEIPEAEIPPEVFQNMSDAEYWAYVGMPEEQRQRYVEDIQRSSATALERSRTRKGGLGLTSAVAQSETDKYRDLVTLDTQMRMKNLSMLYGARERVASERVRAEDINRNIKLDERMRRDKLIGAGIQNIGGAAGTVGMLSAMFPELGGEGGALSLKGLFGGKKKTQVDVDSLAG